MIRDIYIVASVKFRSALSISSTACELDGLVNNAPVRSERMMSDSSLFARLLGESIRTQLASN